MYVPLTPIDATHANTPVIWHKVSLEMETRNRL